MVRKIDCTPLSDFNLLAEARGAIGNQEMLTMVVSSAGAVSDSHTDDPDGSNHCFAGRKLWLVWDTFRGLARGLEDVERCGITGRRAAFDMSAFLSVPGSRWFIVEPGLTLFLPGHLTHKVVTLNEYIGVGSFFVMLPSYWRTLVRWSQHTPLWALDGPQARRFDLVNQITRRVIDKVHALAQGSSEDRLRWGVAYLRTAVENWERASSGRMQRAVLSNPVSLELLREVLDLDVAREERDLAS